ncbi:MAG: hypothetical protein HYU66_10905 [Armatimonadetes bacterium]|nr:hypothetical protein [Armatimonadota bacterium]
MAIIPESEGVTRERGRELLGRAGLDLDTAAPSPIGPAEGEGEAVLDHSFCPYTGARRVLVEGDDFALVGRDSFSRRGRLVRYRNGDTDGAFCEPCDGAALRATRDLYVSSGTPPPRRAWRADAEVEGGPEFDLAAPTVTPVAVATRHGLLYSLSDRGYLACHTLPAGQRPAGWEQALSPPPGRGEPVLRVSESLVYLVYEDALYAWEAGRRDVSVLDCQRPPNQGVWTVRIACDRLLVVRDVGGLQIAELYDLAAVAQQTFARVQPLCQQTLGQVGKQAQELWAESCDEQFLVRAADGSWHVFPFDGAPYRLYDNPEGHRCTDATVIDDPAAGGLRVLFYESVAEPRQQYLVSLPLARGANAKYGEPWTQALPSYQYAPCVIGDQLYQVEESGEGQILRVFGASLDDPSRRKGQATLLGTNNGVLLGLAPVCCAGQALVHVHYAREQSSHHQLIRAELPPDASPGEVLPSSRLERKVEVLWDAARVYLCDLTERRVRQWRPA